MGKGYRLLLFVALALVIAMIVTALWGRGSRHGYGALPERGSFVILVDFTRTLQPDIVFPTRPWHSAASVAYARGEG